MPDDNDEGTEREPLDPKIREELKQARADRKARTETETELATLKRESAFDKAGIPETGTGALLRKSYDGELTKEAIVQAAVEYGILQGSDSGAADELAALRGAHEASAAGGATNVEDPGAKFLRDVENAKTVEEIMVLVAEADPALGMSVPRN